PTYYSASHNSTVANQIVRFGINATDETALNPNGQYVFSTNNTGSWINESSVNFTTTPSWANVTKILNSTETITGYRWYFTDNSGNTNSTPIYTLSNMEAPTYYSASHNSTGAGSLVRFGINVSDNVALETNGQYVFSTNNTGTWVNETYSNWTKDLDINASLPETNMYYHLKPTVFYKDSSWYLISGDFNGNFGGYAWNGTQWKPNSTINASLPDIGDDSVPTVFYKDSSWYMIASELNVNFIGYVWNGTGWAPNSTINASLPSSPSLSGNTVSSVFYKDSSWYLLAGTSVGSDSSFYGYVWNGTNWLPNSTINASLPGVPGGGASPTVFYKDSFWYVLAGAYDGKLYGYSWNGTNWIVNLEINSTLPDVGAWSVPFAFYKDSNWYLLVGSDVTAFNGRFIGFKFVDLGVNFTSTPSWANVTKTLNSTIGTIVGYRWFFSDNAGNTNSTPIYTLTTVNTCTYSSGNWNVDCNDNCTITTNYNLGGNNLSFINAGTFTLNANVTEYDRVSISDRCRIIVNNGQRLGG
ncbi:MAG: hypothetical protein AABY32_03330, partial [Nanoarchaeota archaeon]